MKKRILALSIGAIVVGAGAFTVVSRPSAAQKVRAPVASMTVSLVSAQSAEFVRAIAATGTINARDELVIGSDAVGVRLTEVLVEVGETVKKGQLLARGDDAQLRAQLAQQQAAVKQAQAELAQAQANDERAQRLAGFFSVETIQTKRTAAATAQAKLDLAIAQQRELEIKVAHTRVVAPAAGVISKKMATVGAVVQPGTELFRLIKDGELEWRAELPSHSLQRTAAGATARIATDSGDWVETTVRLVAPTIDTATRNGQVYVYLPKDAAFKAGAHARGEILLGKSEVLSLPESSVLARDGYSYVFTVGADGVAHLTKIEAGGRQNGRVEVSSGIRADARVIAAGAGFVKDGDLVRIAPTVAAMDGGKS
jgi:HlyD family secretion protein